MEQAVVLGEKLWIPKMVAVEIQGDLLASYYKEGDTIREGLMETISLHDLRAINGVPLIDLAMDKDTLSLYMEGLTDGFNASAHCHYGLLVDPDIFSQHRGFVVHVADPSRISSDHLPVLTKEGCNDPDFDWTRPEVKERLKVALNLDEFSLVAEVLKHLQDWLQKALETLNSMLTAVHRLLAAISTFFMSLYRYFCRFFFSQNCQATRATGPFPKPASPPEAKFLLRSSPDKSLPQRLTIG